MLPTLPAMTSAPATGLPSGPFTTPSSSGRRARLCRLSGDAPFAGLATKGLPDGADRARAAPESPRDPATREEARLATTASCIRLRRFLEPNDRRKEGRPGKPQRLTACVLASRMPRKVTRREFMGTAVGTTALVHGGALEVLGAAKRPNVLFILADDLGYGDLSCYGRPDYSTPVLDDFAKQGIKFTSAYAAAPVCTPTRCAYVTGRYPQRLAVGLEEPLKRSSPPDTGLPPDHPTVASLLKRGGYDTSLVGKWHLGWKPEFGPNQHGFDEFFGVLSGADDYFTHRASDAPGPALAEGRPDLWENLTPIERVGYLTDLLSDKAVEIIARPHPKPFFLSLQYTAPHAPWEGPEDEAIGHSTHGPGPMIDGDR